MKIIGILIIVGALILTAVYLRTKKTSTGWVVLTCFLAIFAGAILILGERITEITLEHIGSIKAASDQAVADAEAIREIKEQFEERLEDTDTKIAKLNEAIDNAYSTIEELKSFSEFSSTILAAQNDDWVSFEMLSNWANDTEYPWKELAANAYVTIRGKYGRNVTSPHLIFDWSQNGDPREIPLSEFEMLFETQDPLFHANIATRVWNRGDFSKKDKLKFFLRIYNESKSLAARNNAGNFFIRASGEPKLVNWKPFSSEMLNNWWAENESELE